MAGRLHPCAWFSVWLLLVATFLSRSSPIALGCPASAVLPEHVRLCGTFHGRERRARNHAHQFVQRAAAKVDRARLRAAWDKIAKNWKRTPLLILPFFTYLTRFFPWRRAAPRTTGQVLTSDVVSTAQASIDSGEVGEAVVPAWSKVHHDWRPDPYRISLRVSPLVVVHVLWSLVVVAFHVKTRFQLRMPSLVHPLLVGVLGLLLAFRTNQAFERHWSSCRAWAELHKVLHNFARLASHFSQTDFTIYDAIIRHIIAYPIALKQRLRRRKSPSEFYSVLRMQEIDTLIGSHNPHLMILTSLSMLIRPIRASDDGSGKKLALWQGMDNCIASMQGIACTLELVVGVPLPDSYSLHTSRFLFIWVGTLPFGLVGYMAPYIVPLAVLGVAWALFSTEELAQLMEEPFGNSNLDTAKPETVPLDALCRRIVVELKQHVFMQNQVERRVSERNWVIKPEDLIDYDACTVTDV